MCFSATSFGVYLVEFVLCALLVGRILGPGAVAVFQILMAVTTAYVGLLTMVGTPVWAALVDARARGDSEWVRGTVNRYYRYLFVLAGSAVSGGIILGPILLPLLYGSEFQVSRIVFMGHAFFLACMGWRHVNRMLSIGLGLLPKAVAPIMGGVSLGLLLGVLGLQWGGLEWLFAGLAIGALIIPGWILPGLVRKEVARIDAEKTPDCRIENSTLSRAAMS